jgi:arsenate reductase-like glutaredoxin family protein
VFVDLASKLMAPAELRRFSDRLKPSKLVDDGSRAYRDAGLGYMRLDDGELYERLLKDQRLLRLPLVRAGREVAAGADEETWKTWLAKDAAPQSKP